jgi:hypothetical protein
MVRIRGSKIDRQPLAGSGSSEFKLESLDSLEFKVFALPLDCIFGQIGANPGKLQDQEYRVPVLITGWVSDSLHSTTSKLLIMVAFRSSSR